MDKLSTHINRPKYTIHAENSIAQIPGFPGYAITEDGTVLSFKGLKLRALKPATNKGYLLACLSLDGKPHGKLVHRLVAQAFIPNPEGKPQVNHKDSNRKNNHVANLEWVTPKENMAHAQLGEAMQAIAAEQSLVANLKFDPQYRAFSEPRAKAMLREGATIFDVVKQLHGVTLKRQFAKALDATTKRNLRKQGVPI